MTVKRARPYHHGNLRTTLIEEGLKLIAEKGVRALTLREIGAQAGVSRMAAYRHFTDKEDLLAAIAEAGFVKFNDAIQTARDTAKGAFPERLTAMAFAYVRFATEQPAYIAVMFGRGVNFGRKTEAGDRAFGTLVETIQEGQATGYVRAGDPVLLAQVVWSQVHGMSLLHLASDLSEDGIGRRLIRCSSEILIAGLRPGLDVTPKQRRNRLERPKQACGT